MQYLPRLLAAALLMFGGGRSAELQPFVLNPRGAGPESRIDLSSFLDKPAGRNGFLAARGGHIVRPDGTRQRLWGVNVTDWTPGSVQIPDQNDAVFQARTLARAGINVVRLTFLDFAAPRGVIDATRPDTQALDPAQLDKLDRWIAALKDEGIYTDLNLVVGRTYKAGDGVHDFADVGWAKALTLFDPQLIKLTRDFARQLLTHRNAYTGNEYRKEPAIAIVEMLNENSLFDAWYNDRLRPLDEPVRDANFRPLPAVYVADLDARYQAFLSKTLGATGVAALRGRLSLAADQTVPRLRPRDFAAAPAEQFQAEAAFYTDLERTYYRDMHAYLKNTLGVGSLLLGSNDFLGDQSFYPMLWANLENDVIDAHVYWQHPSWPGVVNTPQVNDPVWSTVVRLGRAAVAGKPFTVSEVNHAFPNDWLCEGVPTLAAYAALQDWDAVMWYTYEPKRDPAHQGFVGDAFDLSLDPVRWPQLAAGALLFLRGDVAPAREQVVRNYTAAQVYETMRLPRSAAPLFTPGFPAAEFLRHRVRIGSFDGPATPLPVDSEGNTFVSDTGELVWRTSSAQNGLITVDTARSQALIGFLPAQPVKLRHLSAVLENRFCAVQLASLENVPIANASHLLLVAAARVENTGLRWNMIRTVVEKTGGPPSVIEPVTGQITLHDLTDAKAVLIRALDGAGRPLDAGVKAERSVAGWTFPIGRPVTTWYEIEITR